MKKFLPIGIILSMFLGSLAAHAALRINAINVNFKGKNAIIQTAEGEYQVSNRIVNNEIIQTNRFVETGKRNSSSVSGSAFDQLFGYLVSINAVDMNAVSNTVMGQTNAAIAGYDSTETDLGPAPVVNNEEVVNQE